MKVIKVKNYEELSRNALPLSPVLFCPNRIVSLETPVLYRFFPVGFTLF